MGFGVEWDVDWEKWDGVGREEWGLGGLGWDGMEEIGLGKGIFISRRGGIGFGIENGGMQVRGWNEFWEEWEGIWNKIAEDRDVKDGGTMSPRVFKGITQICGGFGISAILEEILRYSLFLRGFFGHPAS